MGTVTCTCNARNGANWACTCNARDGSNWACTCNSVGGSNWWTCADIYDSFYLMNDVCPSNTTAWTDPSLSHSVRIKTTHINELRTAIRAEQTRRHLTPFNFGADVVRHKVIKKIETSQLKDKIEELRSYPWVYNYASLRRIDTGIMTEVRAALNSIQKDCICNCNYCTCQCNYCTCDCNYCTCNCNYCTCNCNYCTCDCNYCTCNCNYCTCECNYCTCNCNYCTCNCNYSCTCNCNYSDRELKADIVYL